MARLESINFPALNENVLEKFYSRNIYTVYDFMLFTSDNLIKLSGLNFKEIQNMKKYILKRFGGEIINPINVHKLEKEDIISTGIKNFDSLLEGGFHYRRIYEICGTSSSGKSQLCHWISICTTVNTSTEVHYIDTSSNFCISRIQMILEAKQYSDTIIGKIMSNIKIYQIYKIHDLFRIFYRLSKISNKNSSKSLKTLVIVDSLPLLCTKIANSELNSILSNFASVCRFLVNNFYSIIIIINTIKFQYVGKIFTKNDTNLCKKFKPSLGNYWLCIPNIRLLINYLENTQREICIWNNYHLRNGKKCIVDIRDDGIF